MRPYVRFLPEIWQIEKEALDDEIVRRQVVASLVDTYEYVESGKEDLAHLEYRLLGKEEQMYEEYDRLRSEGIFRLGLALPLVALCLTFAYIDSLWWMAGLPVPVVFAYLGAGSFAEAERGLAAAVSSGRVELPSIERIRTSDGMAQNRSARIKGFAASW